MADNVEDFLAQAGVKGMKWGRRKGNTPTLRTSKDYKTAAKIRKKKVSEMSNEDLKTLTKRIQLEKSYKDLTPNKFTKGQKHVTALLGVVGTVSTIASLPNTPAFKLGVKVINAARRYPNRKLLAIGQ